jgi:uncharacterized protein YutD
MTEIKIGKAVLKIDMHIPNPQGYLSYQAANELQLKLQYNQEWMEEAEKEIKRLNDYVKELGQLESAKLEIEKLRAYTRELERGYFETDKMLNMDTSALHKKD